eukprot:3996370-Amphidinium_carterae.1
MPSGNINRVSERIYAANFEPKTSNNEKLLSYYFTLGSKDYEVVQVGGGVIQPATDAIYAQSCRAPCCRQWCDLHP